MRLHDYGCSLKAYRREVLEGVRLYGEMHRFIPVYASWQGARVSELVVNHRPRTAGRSKYGLGRTLPHLLFGRRGARRRFADDAAQLLARAGEG